MLYDITEEDLVPRTHFNNSKKEVVIIKSYDNIGAMAVQYNYTDNEGVPHGDIRIHSVGYIVDMLNRGKYEKVA